MGLNNTHGPHGMIANTITPSNGSTFGNMNLIPSDPQMSKVDLPESSNLCRILEECAQQLNELVLTPKSRRPNANNDIPFDISSSPSLERKESGHADSTAPSNLSDSPGAACYSKKIS